MSEFVAMIRDGISAGVRADRIEGWEKRGNYADPRTRVYLAGGGVVDLRIKIDEFTDRLDQALTALVNQNAADVEPGPCWHDSEVTMPNADATYRCELKAGHLGAHECERGNGSAVWPA